MSKDKAMISSHDPRLVAKIAARETIKLFLDDTKLLIDESPLNHKAATLYIGEFVKEMLLLVLNDQPLMLTNEELHAHIAKTYEEVKQNLEEILGQAFTVAIKKFTKTNLTYGCEITPIPVPDPKKDT